MSCCPDGSWPALRAPADYKPLGSVLELPNSLPVYEVGEPSAKNAIIVLPEVFGWEGRLKGICDTFAANGYYTVMPDIMRGDNMSLHLESDEKKQAFLNKWAQWDSIEGDCQSIIAHIASKGITSIGSIGFCWGAWVVWRASAAGLPIRAGAGCHPSIRLEGYSGGSAAALVTKIQCPMLLAPGRNDPDDVKESGEVAKLLLDRFPTSRVKDYPTVDHGWVSRGDIRDETVAIAVKDALEQCNKFFADHLV